MAPVQFPLRIDGRGRTATCTYEQHVENLLEQLLFTNAGERVNRPSFGGGILQMVFSPTSDEIAAATRFLVGGAVQQWLGDVLQVETVDVQQQDSTLTITVVYTLRKTNERVQSTFQRSV